MKVANPTRWMCLVLLLLAVLLGGLAWRSPADQRMNPNLQVAAALDSLTIAVDGAGQLILSRDLPVLADGSVYEVWSLGDEGTARSLGTIRGVAREPISLPEGLRRWLVPGSSIAITIEAAGGSPNGQPTGAMIFSGRIVSASRG